MRNISFFVIAAALILAGIGGWIASTTTHASAVKVDEPFRHERIPLGGGLFTLPLAF